MVVDMKLIEPYLDSLHTISYDVIKKELKETDKIYKLTGQPRYTGCIVVKTIAEGIYGGLSYFSEHPKTGFFNERPTTLEEVLFDIGTESERMNIKRSSQWKKRWWKIRKEKRKLDILKDGTITRYILERQDGSRYEITNDRKRESEPVKSSFFSHLPKISYEVLDRKFEEGDRIFGLCGFTGNIGNIDIRMIDKGTHGGLSYYYDHPLTGQPLEVPTNIQLVKHNIGTLFVELEKKHNERSSPLLMTGITQRKLKIRRGDVVERYILQKKDGTTYEIVI
jgi:hypothetical protein